MVQVRSDAGLQCGRGERNEEEGTGWRDIQEVKQATPDCIWGSGERGDSKMTLKFPGGVTATNSDTGKGTCLMFTEMTDCICFGVLIRVGHPSQQFLRGSWMYNFEAQEKYELKLNTWEHVKTEVIQSMLSKIRGPRIIH